MVSKIFLGMALVSSIAFLAMSLVVGQEVEGALHKATQASAEQMVSMVRTSVEQAMLSGNGIKVKALVVELKKSAGEKTEIHIYDANGVEVFAPKPPAPEPDEVAANVATVLKDRTRLRDKNKITRCPWRSAAQGLIVTTPKTRFAVCSR